MHLSEFITMSLVVILIIIVVLKIIRKRQKQSITSKNTSNDFDSTEVIENVTMEHSKLISSAFIKVNKLYRSIIRDLATQDYLLLIENKKKLKKLNLEVEILKDEIFVHLKSKSTTEVNQFYILTIENLEDMVYAMKQILKISKVYIKKNQKKLTFNQIRELKSINVESGSLFNKIDEMFFKNDVSCFNELSSETNILIHKIDRILNQHIERINSTNSNSKNFKVYTKLLRKSNELFESLAEILLRYRDIYKQS